RCRRTMPAPGPGGNGMNGDGTPQPTGSGGVTLTEGPFAGWTTWSQGGDPYESLIGPFYFRSEPEGGARCVFEPKPHHCNGGGAIHGGCLMSFADFSLFAIAHKIGSASCRGRVQTLSGKVPEG